MIASPLNGDASAASPEGEEDESASLMVPPNPLSVPVGKEMTVEDSLVRHVSYGRWR